MEKSLATGLTCIFHEGIGRTLTKGSDLLLYMSQVIVSIQTKAILLSNLLFDWHPTHSTIPTLSTVTSQQTSLTLPCVSSRTLWPEQNAILHFWGGSRGCLVHWVQGLGFTSGKASEQGRSGGLLC